LGTAALRMRYHRFVPSYYVENFGCRATQADGAALERQFEREGLDRASAAAQASVVVLNTCTVTAAADQDARAAIRRVQRQNPSAKIVVTGCYAQRAPEEIAALPGVSCVVGNSHKHQLAELALQPFRPEILTDIQTVTAGSRTFIPLSTLAGWGRRPILACPELNEGTGDQRRIYVSDIFAHTELLAAPVFDTFDSHESIRTRPNLKVQDGCDNRCSFCVIPSVRGQSRSLLLAQIIAEVNTLVAAGYRELVISGINLGRWGRDLVDQRPSTHHQQYDFESLIRAILSDTSLEKLRISSVEPMDWTDDLIALVAESPRIAKHTHVPLQSGSDAVLRRMHRKYRPWHYREKIEKIRTAMPSAAIGADVMTGFPGETDAEFEATRLLIEDLPFTYLHVFTYSPRPATPAADMPNQVPIHIARERNKILRELAEEKKQVFMRSFVGHTVDAITLGKYGAAATAREVEGVPTFTEALTDNYLKLRLAGSHASNQWIAVKVEEVEDGTLIGRPLLDQ
jgi:threonylcarbamoyladenosine tRNA methylthiotransferase MtaB